MTIDDSNVILKFLPSCFALSLPDMHFSLFSFSTFASKSNVAFFEHAFSH